MAAKPTTASATERARMPGVSKVGLKGGAPPPGQRPIVVLSPTVPVSEAGILIEPPASLPSASAAEPSHKLAPAPELEAPLPRCWRASHGVAGAPPRGLGPVAPEADGPGWALPGNTPSGL